MSRHGPAARADVEAALAYLDPTDRDLWVRIGMALRAEFGDDGFTMFDTWSQLRSKYNAKSTLGAWRGFKARRISIGTLFFEAQRAGYEPQRDRTAPAPSAAQLEAMRQRRAAEQEREARAAERRALRAGDSARMTWRRASRAGESPYLARKQVLPEAVRFFPDGKLVMPVIRYDWPREQALVGVQIIDADGGKLFTRGMAKRGGACRLGDVQAGAPILICEGLATGLTIRMALGRRLPVFVALDAGNLLPVATIVRQIYPDAYLLFCADDDFLTRGNPGQAAAWKAAGALGNADMVYPIFQGQRETKLTDFNDLHVTEGLPVVADQFARVLDFAKSMGRYAD